MYSESPCFEGIQSLSMLINSLRASIAKSTSNCGIQTLREELFNHCRSVEKSTGNMLGAVLAMALRE